MTTIHRTLQIPDKYSNKRIDQVLAQLIPEYSRSCLTKWLKEQKITIDGKYLAPKDKILGGETIIINATLQENQVWQAQDIKLNIIYEDDSLIIINKPANLVVHPGAGNYDGTLVNALLNHAPILSELPRAGLIHRLDKDTTGLLVVAKTLRAHHALIDNLQKRLIKREYQAIAHGNLKHADTIDAPIGRHPKNRKKMTVISRGKPAVTHYKIHHAYQNHTHLDIQLETGRTHQIRVHMSYIKHPLVGDKTYGGREYKDFKRPALHAYRLSFTHPKSKEHVQYTAPLPDDFIQLITELKQDE